MSSLMCDVITGKVAAADVNAAANAGGKILKAVELRLKYGTQGPDPHKSLNLSNSTLKQLQ